MYKDRIPHQVFSVILNTASLILETLQLRIEPGFIDFLFDLQVPTTFDDYCGKRRSQEQLTSLCTWRPAFLPGERSTTLRNTGTLCNSVYNSLELYKS